MPEVYGRDGYIEGYPEGIERHFWHISRNDIVYRWLVRRLKPQELVMDVGCGTGHVVREFRSRGMNIQGVEMGSPPISPGMEAVIHTKRDLFDLDASLKARINTVLLLDVIEHMAERREFLRRLFEELPNCRQLLITVPARKELWSEYDEYWGHHLRYDRHGLEADLAGSGFAPRKTSYFFHWLYLASRVLGWLRIPKRTDFQPVKPGTPKAFFHRTLGLFTRLESRLVPGSLAGSSLICIADRTD